MRLSTAMLLSLSAVLLPGCTYTVHPILLESDVTTDVDLSGTWRLKPGGPAERTDWGLFTIKSVDGGASYHGAFDNGKAFVARIGKLGDERYLQVSVMEQKAKEPGLLSSLPIYAIARFEVVDDELRIFPVGLDRAIPWFDEHNVHYRLIDTGVKHCVLTDDTPTLQKLVKDHGDELFAETGLKFTRKPVVAIQEIEARQESSDKEQAEAVRKLKFLVGTWKSVDPPNAPPAPETRSITMQPDGLGLTITTETVLGTHVGSVTYDAEEQAYLLTHKTAGGERIINRAKLTAANTIQILVPESPARLLSGCTFVVTVSDDSWTETLEWPAMKNQTAYERSFVRQQPDP